MGSQAAIRAGGGFLEFSLRDKAFKKSLRNLEQRMRRFGMNMVKIGSVAMAGGLSIAGLFAIPVKFASDLENTVTEFEVLTGSADDALRIINELDQFSKISLIPVKVLQEGTRTLLGYGVAAADIVPITKAIAEISRGSADRMKRLSLAFGQTQAKTRLYAQEVRQFVESGLNPLQQITQKTGESMKEVSERLAAGAISAEEVADALIAATEAGGRFEGLLDKMSKTASGQWAKIKASIMLATRPIGVELLPLLKKVFEVVLDLIDPLAKWIKTNMWLILSVGAASVGLMVFGAVMTTLGVGLIVAAIAMSALAAAAGFLVSPMGLLLTLVTAVTAWLIKAGLKTEWFAEKWSFLTDVVRKSFKIMNALMASGEFLAAADVLWAGLKVAWLKGTEEIREIWAAVWGSAVELAATAFAGIETAWSHVTEFFTTSLGAAIDTMKILWNEFIGFMQIGEVLVQQAIGKVTAAEADSWIAVIDRMTESKNETVRTLGKIRDIKAQRKGAGDRGGIDKLLAGTLAAIREGTVSKIKEEEDKLKKAIEVWKASIKAGEEILAAADGWVHVADPENNSPTGAAASFAGNSAGIFNSAAIGSLLGPSQSEMITIARDQLRKLNEIADQGADQGAQA